MVSPKGWLEFEFIEGESMSRPSSRSAKLSRIDLHRICRLPKWVSHSQTERRGSVLQRRTNEGEAECFGDRWRPQGSTLTTH